MNELCDDLAGVQRDIVERLSCAARDRRHPMHLPVLGTADGELRTVVLRACDSDLAMLRIHTDARSPKLRAIEAAPAVGLLAFDSEAKVQIRARGTARVESHGPIADAAWAEASAYARRCYLAAEPPGSRSDGPVSGLPPEVEGIRPSEAQLFGARDNFAVVLICLTSLDWLHLAHSGHRRARFERVGAGARWQGTWVVP